MVTLAKKYLAYRRSLGYELATKGLLLMKFAKYADRSGHRGPITTELVLRWLQLSPDAARCYQAEKLDAIRPFARYRAIFDPATEIPPGHLLGRSAVRITPYIYSRAEIRRLLAAARRLAPRDGLRPHTYATFLGLIASAGLRLCEVIKLSRSDVDWEQSLLTIRMTKFRKSRLVPLHPTTLQAMRSYAQFRDRFHPFLQTDRFFVTDEGRPLSPNSVHGIFSQRLRPAVWTRVPNRNGRAPRIHDLRHTFACRRLLQWYKEEVDIDHSIAALSTYLGHAEVRSTYWYLTGVPELLELAAARFEQFALPQPGGST